jgi:hypothetical protein
MDSSVEGVDATIELLVESGKFTIARRVMFLEKPQSFPHYFAGGVVAAGIHFSANEFFEFSGKGNVHEEGLQFFHFSANNKDCQSWLSPRRGASTAPVLVTGSAPTFGTTGHGSLGDGADPFRGGGGLGAAAGGFFGYSEGFGVGHLLWRGRD